jgi:molybdopterin/thiamine biosynthesis adenylyltransferase
MTRKTAIVTEAILPQKGERELHGGASFMPSYVERVTSLALEKGMGIAFLHSHFTPGWQGMSPEDITAEERLAPRVFAATDLPLLGLTMGVDGALSARMWHRVGRGQFSRDWCGTVRFIGDEFNVTFMDKLAPRPAFKEELKRTYSAWGDEKQNLLARLHCGVIGVGSVGAQVAEALARMGVEHISLIDFDKVKKHNLDRLLHATFQDIGKLKVDVAADVLKTHATADNFKVHPYSVGVTCDDGLKTALDCDIVFSCVDRPWPRQVHNMIATAHLIPVIDGGVRLSVTKSQSLRSADWRAHTVVPGRPCLECLGQFDPAHVPIEREGLYDDPSYIESLPKDHFIHRNENVFGFSMNAAGLMILQFLSLIVQPGGISDPGAQIFHFVPGTLDKDRRLGCNQHCIYKDYLGFGDHFPFKVV